MDEQALIRFRLRAMEEENRLLKQTLVKAHEEEELCACGMPHKLTVYLTAEDLLHVRKETAE